MALFIPIFICLFLVVILAVGLGQAFLQSRQKQQVRTMLRRAQSNPKQPELQLLRPENVEDPLTRALSRFRIFSHLNLLIDQAGIAWTSGKLVLASISAALVGLLLGICLPDFFHPGIAGLLLALVVGSGPLLIVLWKRSKRIAEFEEQFPEALDFLARSMRAGHGFSIGLEMLVADSPEPLLTCFRRVLADLHLGSSLETALGKLTTLIPLIDVRFFVSAVLLQQETGGNLSEVLNNMAQIIRERFRLKGQVKAASAHGRITGLILAVMPALVAVLLFVASPKYLMVLANDPDGRLMIMGAIAGQIIGYLCIRKIVNIKV
jgi:tight adherence protein B